MERPEPSHTTGPALWCVPSTSISTSARIELRPVRTEIERSLEYCRLALMLVSPRARVESFLTIESVAKTGERVVRRSKALLPWSAVGPVEMVNGALWAEATRWVAGIVQD